MAITNGRDWLICGLVVLQLVHIEPAAAQSGTLQRHAPIYIDTNLGFRQAWSGVTSGSGSAHDPFIIEGWDIRREYGCGPWDPCGAGLITIERTTAHFVIRHVRVSGSLMGISLVDAPNGTLQDIEINDNDIGMLLTDSSPTMMERINIRASSDVGLQVSQTSGRIEESEFADSLEALTIWNSGVGWEPAPYPFTVASSFFSNNGPSNTDVEEVASDDPGEQTSESARPVGAVRVGEGRGLRLENNRFVGNHGSSIAGFASEGQIVSGGTIVGNTILNTSGPGVFIQQMDGWRIDNNIIAGNEGPAIQLKAVSNATVRNGSIEANKEGIRLQYMQNDYFEGEYSSFVSIENNRLLRNHGPGLWMTGRHHRVASNHIEESLRWGIHATVNGTVFSGNILSKNGGWTTGGLYLEGFGNTVEENTFEDHLGTALELGIFPRRVDNFQYQVADAGTEGDRTDRIAHNSFSANGHDIVSYRESGEDEFQGNDGRVEGLSRPTPSVGVFLEMVILGLCCGLARRRS